MSTMEAGGGSAVERGVARVIDPAAYLAGTPGHKARRLIDRDDPGFADPFLLMAEDWMPHGAFAVHPHRGIETVSFVIEGTVEHHDDAGHRGIVRSGDAQWMTAGRGVLHQENALPGTIAHILQLWVNLPAALKKGVSQLSLRSGARSCRLLLFCGPPLGEPVIFGGPFVMNAEEEVQQAFRDFANHLS